MLLINITGIIIILLNLAGLVYLVLIRFRNISENLNKNVSKRTARPNIHKKNTNSNIIEENIIKDNKDMLDDLDLSDFDDLNLDDFD
ncbi:MAG: hypothetical protein GY707_15980 [Desulfobacteraceae bacterium]|nr:hypothetical protein [Desulfobacteraceae bacterium]